MNYDLDFLPETLPGTSLQWPGATASQLDFMRAVYDAHVARSSARHAFVADVPAAELSVIEGSFLARTAAASACQSLLAAARLAISSQGLNVTLGLTSAYRSATRQLRIWQDNFPTYYQETRTRRRALASGEHSSEAAQLLAAYVGQRVGAPGFSNHNNGLAVDFGVQENGTRVVNRTQATYTARWRQTWTWGWLTTNAARFNFYQNPNIDEPWHWEYRPAATATEAASDEEAADVATELLSGRQVGRLALSNSVLHQLEALAQTGSIPLDHSSDTVVPSPTLLALLQALLRGTPPPAAGTRAPFGLMSLVRPRASYHTRGQAVDISRFAGHDIRMTNPARALQAVLAIIDLLPAGCYALGLPRPVRADADGARRDHARYGYLNLYQPGNPPTLRPEYENLPAANVFLPVNSQADIDVSPSHGNIARDLDFIVDATAQSLLRTAVANARQRGARIKYLFPDALDHLHIQVVAC
ncbi:D-alanyl-D-alanine carboxypeptidase family protein [Hymenobacter sp. BT664]|uniref:D-alanyl-D-alanine carboxypeptidase family protein n=1 Tax=Hymenobacter montanus TaxID=2771359 RepID=A0A927BC56_9BACT|nr:M15 family metallopeptidase [Hymenobacter montanus]MBD2768080.1 D-alanyl-D-alanine carboxypeptidase family protein [Hymenobacter montanus]